MTKIVSLLAVVGAATAFAPSQQGRVYSTAIAGKFDGEVGAIPPLGYFDPLGLCSDGNQATFDRLRETEIKHGRVSMLATVGYLATAAGWRFPGAEDVPDGFASFPALLNSADGRSICAQMVAFFAVAEIINRDADWTEAKSEFIGDYRNGFLDFGWDNLSDQAKISKRNIELNNGRAAMMGILGLMVHECLGVSILPGNYLPGAAAAVAEAAPTVVEKVEAAVEVVEKVVEAVVEAS